MPQGCTAVHPWQKHAQQRTAVRPTHDRAWVYGHSFAYARAAVRPYTAVPCRALTQFRVFSGF